MDPTTVDCSFVLHIPLTISPDACAAARAAIRAAEIQAKAARHAGTLGLTSGLITFAAAIMAVAGAYWAARIQVAPVENRDRVLKRTFDLRLKQIARRALVDINMLADALAEHGYSHDKVRSLDLAVELPDADWLLDELHRDKLSQYSILDEASLDLLGSYYDRYYSFRSYLRICLKARTATADTPNILRTGLAETAVILADFLKYRPEQKRRTWRSKVGSRLWFKKGTSA